MTIPENNHSVIDLQKEPYQFLHEITGIEKNLLRDLDCALAESHESHDTTVFVQKVLDEYSDRTFCTITDFDKQIIHVLEVIDQ